MVGFYPLFIWRLGRGLPRTQVFFISQLMLQSCDNPTNMLTDFNLVVGFWFCENKYFHRRKVLPMKYRSPQDRATGRHRCWWVKLFLSSGFQPKLPKQPKQCFPILFQQASPAWPMFWWDEPTITRGEDFLKAVSRCLFKQLAFTLKSRCARMGQ